MKKCILCGSMHQPGTACKLTGADAEMWKHRFPQAENTSPVNFSGTLYKFGEHSAEIDTMEKDLLEEQEKQHIAKKRGRPRNHG